MRLLCQFSQIDEKREGARLLRALKQRGDLTLEQLALVVKAIYRKRNWPCRIDERREGTHLLNMLEQRGELTV